jgi:NAD(P)-dependent dehydrogenase (short-subunit alcohol dehydrogenase family)
VLLEDRVGIVAGAGLGIGRSIALAFAREGADVALAARSEQTLRAVVTEVEALGRRAICVTTDITDAEQCRRLAEATHTAFGRVDVLVNNAALARPITAFADSDLAEWRRPMEVNYWGTLNMTHAVVPYMRERGGGRVIMINASSARSAAEGFGAYTGSKAALQGICRTLARELGRWGIRVNSVVPSSTDSPSFRRFCAQEAEQRGVDPQVLYDEAAARNALGYVPTADEVAGAVMFFASDLSSAATGQFLHVDGGYLFG